MSYGFRPEVILFVLLSQNFETEDEIINSITSDENGMYRHYFIKENSN
jgi:hypothetical protein